MTVTAPPQRVVLYVRVSTDEQTLGHSLDSQRNDLVAFAATLGGEVVETYIDAGASGTSAEGRPEFMRMVADAEGGAFDAVLVARVDRFARNVADSAIYRRRLAEHGVRVLSLAEPSVGDDTPAGFLTQGLHDLMAQHYSVQLAANVTRGKRTRWEKGLPNGMPPFGYQQLGVAANDPPTLVAEEAAVVREAFEMFASGIVSYVEIAARLNARGFRTRRRAPRGRPGDGPRAWSGDSVRDILRNPMYRGAVTYKGEERPGLHEPIITEELWWAAARMARTMRGMATSSRRRRFYPLASIVRCSACGSTLQGQASRSGERYRYYRHNARRRGIECPAPSRGIRADFLEGDVDNIVARFEMPPDVRERVLALLRDEPDPDPAASRGRIEERLRRLARAYTDLGLDEAEYEAQRRTLQAELDRLSIPVEKASAAAEHFDLLQDAWARATAEEKRGLALALFETIYVDIQTLDIADVVVQPAFRPWLSRRTT